MAVSKNFVVKNGLEVADTLVYGTSALDKVGIGSTIPKSKLDVTGNLRAEGDLRAAGFGTVTLGFEVGVGGTMLTVESSGFTGVNKAIPLYSLDVVKIGTGETAINAVGSVVATENVTIGGTVTASRGSFTDYVNIAGVTTLASDGGITTTGGNLFVGDSLDVDGHTELDQLSVSGVTTFIGNVNSDLVNISSGLVTSLVVSGFSSLSGASVDGIAATSVIVSGIATFSDQAFVNSGFVTSLVVSGFSTFSGVAADGIGATSINVSGVSTFVGLSTFNNGLIVEAGIATFVTTIDADAGINATGVITATSYRGDASSMTGFPAGSIGIQSAGTVISTGATTLNFVGSGNTFSVNGNVVDISIAGGGGGGVGTAINYSNGLPSPFSYVDEVVTVTQDITLDDTNAGLGSSYILVQEPQLRIPDGTTVTVGAGKTIITDLFMLEGRPGWDLDPRFTTLGVTGVSTLGVTTFTGNVSIGVSMLFGDNDKLMLGDGDDLQLFHDGSNSLIEDVGTGGLQLRSDTSVTLRRRSNGDVMLLATPASSVELNFNNSKKFETTNDGVIVTGICTATSFVGDITGTASDASAITVADESSDTSCFPVFVTAATGSLAPKTGTNITFDSSSGTLTCTSFSGDGSGLTGVASTDFIITSTASTMASINSTGIITATGGFVGDVTGASTRITLTNQASDTTCFPVFCQSETGNQLPHTNSSLTFDSSNGTLAATNVNSTSDANLKENIETIVGSIDILKGINGVRFIWKDLGTPSVGVVAQEVEQVLPELVAERGDNGTKSVNYNGLVGVLIEAVKELSTRVESLENQLNNQ